MLFDGRRMYQLVSGDAELSALMQRRRKSIPPDQRAKESPNIAIRGAVLAHVEFAIICSLFFSRTDDSFIEVAPNYGTYIFYGDLI